MVDRYRKPRDDHVSEGREVSFQVVHVEHPAPLVTRLYSRSACCLKDGSCVAWELSCRCGRHLKLLPNSSKKHAHLTACRMSAVAYIVTTKLKAPTEVYCIVTEVLLGCRVYSTSGSFFSRPATVCCGLKWQYQHGWVETVGSKCRS